jgi:hypothetical protein
MEQNRAHRKAGATWVEKRKVLAVVLRFAQDDTPGEFARERIDLKVGHYKPQKAVHRAPT